MRHCANVSGIPGFQDSRIPGFGSPNNNKPTSDTVAGHDGGTETGTGSSNNTMESTDISHMWKSEGYSGQRMSCGLITE